MSLDIVQGIEYEPRPKFFNGKVFGKTFGNRSEFRKLLY
jgi:hypothetical protein